MKYSSQVIIDICTSVAPLVGAWIEIGGVNIYFYNNDVAPLVGAWIEIPIDSLQDEYKDCRSSRRSVD